MSQNKRETLIVKHADFTLYISAGSLASPRKKLAKTYQQRGKPIPQQVAIVVEGAQSEVLHTLDDSEKKFDPLTGLFFFENRPYHFEIEFKDKLDSAYVAHKHRLIEDSFYWNRRHNSLQASLNFANDVGRCSFTICYQIAGIAYRVPVHFTVFATKMVVDSDLQQMNLAIDHVYPQWRYAITGKTEQSQASSGWQAQRFELFWLAQFERLVDEFHLGMEQIINSPHNRLQSFTHRQRLDRIRRPLSPKQQQKAKQLIATGCAVPRMAVEYQRLHLDTDENRFIKMVLKQTRTSLAKLGRQWKGNKNISDSYQRQFEQWQYQINKTSQHRLWRDVGAFKGVGSDSKVLHQATGYAKVYRVWQQLKHYLNAFNGEAKLSVKSLAEIYEVWCFIEVMQVLKTLGFKEVERSLHQLKQAQFEKQFSKNEMASAFIFQRPSDGMLIELVHEPTFSPTGEVNRTWSANQRPDIVLRVTLSNGESFLILFDAKYRIDSDQFKHQDGVPEDALNQMHRYRDAIIHQQKLHQASDLKFKSRPVMGAFALYPGHFSQTEQHNPYQEAIDEIGIGAFALLPSEGSARHNVWLTQYLTTKLGVSEQTHYSHDHYFTDDATRIGPYGGAPIRHHGLTMVAPLNEIGRTQSYLDDAHSGKLKGYHTKLIATDRQSVHRNIIREVRYMLIPVREQQGIGDQVAHYLYRVSEIKLLPRKEIPVELTGKAASDDTHHYWLFKFDDSPIKLDQGLRKPYVEHFQFKLTKAEYLNQLSHWDEIDGEYQFYRDLYLA